MINELNSVRLFICLYIEAIKSDIIEELEKHRDDELAELRDKRQKAATTSAAAAVTVEDNKTAVSSADVVSVSIHCFMHSSCMRVLRVMLVKVMPVMQFVLVKVMPVMQFALVKVMPVIQFVLSFV